MSPSRHLACITAGLLAALLGSARLAADDGTINVACVGDSITQITGYPKKLQELLGDAYVVGNFGVSGATAIANSASKSAKPYIKQAKFKEALAAKPHIVVFMLGTNDTRKPGTYTYIEDFPKDYQEIIKPFIDLEGKPKLFLALPVPIFGQGNFGLNKEGLEEGVLPRVRALATDLKIPLIDTYTPLKDKDAMFKDRIHPNKDGAAIIAETVAAAIKAAVAAK